jgi:thiamine-phosphate pyrophosphorylase
VLEDFCRFVLDDAFLSRELKTMRHHLADALQQLPAHRLLASRETLRDVGTAISTPSELDRASLSVVVEANCKRLQEALRSLEEFSKLHSAALAQDMEELRYQSYTLERMLLLGQLSRRRLQDIRLYVLFTAAQCWGGLEQTLRQVIEGGGGMIQLREKDLGDRDLLERARQVRRWTRETGTLFIMNDRPDVARLVEADGVHLGQDDLPVKEARRLLGPGAIIGVSTHNIEQVQQAIRDGADYIGVGPTFPSQTKTFDEFPGLDFVRQASEETSLPAFVIGGVNLGNIPDVIAAGGKRVAVSQSLCGSETPEALARAMRDLLEGVR